MTDEEAMTRLAARAEQAAEALRVFGLAAAKVPMPSLAEIAQWRLSALAADHGWFRFVMPEYWRWQRLAHTLRQTHTGAAG